MVVYGLKMFENINNFKTMIPIHLKIDSNVPEPTRHLSTKLP